MDDLPQLVFDLMNSRFVVKVRHAGSAERRDAPRPQGVKDTMQADAQTIRDQAKVPSLNSFTAKARRHFDTVAEPTPHQ